MRDILLSLLNAALLGSLVVLLFGVIFLFLFALSTLPPVCGALFFAVFIGGAAMQAAHECARFLI